jgi:hypothetical protein
LQKYLLNRQGPDKQGFFPGCVIPSLAVGTLKNIMRQAGISVEEFVAAYEEK